MQERKLNAQIQLFLDSALRHPKLAPMPQAVLARYARQMERSCRNSAIEQCKREGILWSFSDARFVAIYSEKCSRIMSNLDPTSTVGSAHLGDIIAADPNICTQVANMRDEELCPLAAAREREEIAIRSAQKVEVKISTQYECGRCGQKKTQYVEAQLRALDEPSNRKVVCVSCGHKWTA